MAKFKIITILFSLLGFSFYQKSDNKIIWNNAYQLKWEDFRKKAPSNNRNAAISSIGISSYYEYKSKENTLYFDIASYFTKNESWVKEDKKSDDLLKHEQGHFNINEIYARKLRKAVSSHSFKMKSSKEDFEKLYQKNQNELNAAQELYDKETNHHIIETMQSDWNQKIAKELQELTPYSEPHLYIKVK